MTTRTIHLIGAPTSAGAHTPGQEKAPAALRQAGLADVLAASGTPVIDRGDLPERRWRVARTETEGHLVNNLDETIAAANDVAAEVGAALDAGGFPLVVGGDCTITVGAIAGTLRAGMDPTLVYVDGGWDLGTPRSYPMGILDSMVAAHLLGLKGTTRLRDIGPRSPMLGHDQYVQFGHVPEGPASAEGPTIDALGLRAVPASDIMGRGELAAHETLDRWLGPDDRYLLHFDVDVINFFDLPVADVPEYDIAIPAADAFAAVRVFASDPRCTGMTVTEFNPDHGHPDGREAATLVHAVADSLTPVA